MNLDQMGINEWLLIAGTITSPILAVRAQKWWEKIREGANRREWVFLQLMATRQQRLSPDHVRALNTIDIAFYGPRRFARLRRIPQYQDVLETWTIYRAHLSPTESILTKPLEERIRFDAKADELFVNLLEKLAIATRYDFKREELQSGSYSPIAHGEIENENTELRLRTLALLRGELTLPLEVRSMPTDPAAIDRMLESQGNLTQALNRVSDTVAAAITPRQGASG